MSEETLGTKNLASKKTDKRHCCDLRTNQCNEGEAVIFMSSFAKSKTL